MRESPKSPDSPDTPTPTAEAASCRTAMVARLDSDGRLRDRDLRAALLSLRREVLLPRAYVRRNARGAEPGEWQLLDGAHTLDRTEWLEVIHSGASVLVQHDGEDLLTQVRRTVTGGAITGLSSVLEMTVDVLEQVKVRSGMRCLELGTGTGITAALLRHLVGREGAVVSVEADPHLARAAQQRLAAAGSDVEVVAGDGLAGCPRSAPYHRIMATFAVPRLPLAWLEQLADDGTLWTSLATSSPSWPATVVARRRGERIEAELFRARSSHRPMTGFDWLNLRGYQELRRHVPGNPAGTVAEVPGEEEYGFWLAVSHLVPGLVRKSDEPDLTLAAPREQSWAVLRPAQPGHLQVEAGGRRALWTELEEVHRRWLRAGRPDRYRVTVSQDGRQYVHAGRGVDELRWELPERLAEVRPAGVIA